MSIPVSGIGLLALLLGGLSLVVLCGRKVGQLCCEEYGTHCRTFDWVAYEFGR